MQWKTMEQNVPRYLPLLLRIDIEIPLEVDNTPLTGSIVYHLLPKFECEHVQFILFWEVDISI